MAPGGVPVSACGFSIWQVESVHMGRFKGFDVIVGFDISCLLIWR